MGVRFRLGNNLATRLEELERVLKEPLPYDDYCYPINNGHAFFRRILQYEHAIAGDSDVKLAECLWENLASSEIFEFDDKTFYDYKLCANFVDSQNQVLLDHQRHFRKHTLGFCLPEEEPLISNRDQLEKLLEFDF